MFSGRQYLPLLSVLLFRDIGFPLLSVCCSFLHEFSVIRRYIYS